MLNLLIFYLLKKLGDVVIGGYFCCPPLPQAVLVVTVLNLNLNTYNVNTAPRGKGGGKMPQFEELLR